MLKWYGKGQECPISTTEKGGSIPLTYSKHTITLRKTDQESGDNVEQETEEVSWTAIIDSANRLIELSIIRQEILKEIEVENE